MIIIYVQGKYEEAYEFMTTHDQKISDFDVRPTLYKVRYKTFHQSFLLYF